MRLRMVPQDTNWDFFRIAPVTLGLSSLAMIGSILLVIFVGLNFGIDFKGGTTIRTESAQPIDIGTYRDALQPLELGDVSLNQIFDPTFREDQHVAMIRIEAQQGQESATTGMIERVEAALQSVAPDIQFVSVESVGPKVSGELIWDDPENV